MAYYTKYNNKNYNLNLNAVDSTKYPTADTSGRPCSTTDYTTGIHQATGFYTGTTAIYVKLAHALKVTVDTTHVKSVSLTYVNIDGTSTTVTPTSTTTYYGKPGSNYSWTATAKDYCYITANASGSGTLSVDAEVKPTADYGYYYVSGTVSNGSIKVGTSSTLSSITATGIVAKYGSTVYCKVNGNTYYYFGDATATGVADAGKLVNANNQIVDSGGIVVNKDNFTISSKTPGTSSSGITTPTAQHNFGSCTSYPSYTYTGTTSNGSLTVYRKSHALGTTSYATISSGTTIYAYDNMYVEARCSLSNYRHSSSSCHNNGNAISTEKTYYLTTNSSRTGWTYTTSNSSSTGIVCGFSYGSTSNPISVSGNVIASIIGANMSWVYHQHSGTNSTSWINSGSTTFSAMNNASVTLTYWPYSAISYAGRICLQKEGTNSGIDYTVLSGSKQVSLTYLSISGKATISMNSTMSSTLPQNSVSKLNVDKKAGAYKFKADVWGCFRYE